VMAGRIFDPLGMDDTTYTPDRFDNDGVAHGYFDLMGDRVLVDSTESYANMCIGPDGGMISSARDLRTFYEHLFVVGDLLTSASLDEMMPNVPTGEEDFPLYGLGMETWGQSGPQGIGHGGHEFGYRTFAYHFPAEDITFVFWVNASSLQPTADNIAAVINEHRDHIRDIVLGAEN
ncbi:MAG: serine hydrolase domain-containing protein, partial [Myxococcota bacterium]